MICPASKAAAFHAIIGNVSAGSTFAVLQSAGAGGAGLAVVNTVAGTATTVMAMGATALGFAKSTRKGKEESRVDVHDEDKKPNGKL
jgi:hypothetical protein